MWDDSNHFATSMMRLARGFNVTWNPSFMYKVVHSLGTTLGLWGARTTWKLMMMVDATTFMSVYAISLPRHVRGPALNAANSKGDALVSLHDVPSP